ncbi:DUF6082 family protein [Nonomuraea sp. NPDC048892]|uniref:DUF6082 family protein n=1 Tax=Nonomuraea sp. NPDC048892 TaxID=3154624 RepID=UPI0033CDA609
MATAGGAALTLLSPVLLQQINLARDADWNRLSQIGQTYGAASAILSGFALIGVVSSLILQGKETRATRKESARGYHVQLMEMAMRDPVYLDCWGSLDRHRTPDELRQHLYLNLIVSYWEMRYQVGDMPDRVLRSLATAELFTTTPGRRFWAEARIHRLRAAKNRKMRRFNEIMESAYQATPEIPPTPAPSEAPKEKSHLVAGAAAGAAIGLVGGWMASRRHSVRGRPQ